MDSRINNGICRCCASEGTFKDLATTYHWMGEEEIYAEMLKECFDIQLSAAEDSEQGGICEVCITQLRNASNFKKQVLHTEKQFKKRLQDKLFKSSIVKVEVPGPDDDALESDNDNNDDFSGTEYDVPIKEEEPADEPKPRKRAARATTSRAKKSKTERGETSTKRHHGITIKVEKIEVKKSTWQNRLPKNEMVNNKLRRNSDDEKSIEMIAINEIHKHKTNIKEIIMNSNATPIRGHAGIGYVCSFCPEQFPDPANLKTHTSLNHPDISKAYFMKETLFDFYVKLDITGLHCNICDGNIDTIDGLINHLAEEHCIKVYKGVTNRFLPFKFDTECLQCCICFNAFNKFKTLLSHVYTSHFRNYICDVCEAGFVNLRNLKGHKISHQIGSFKCDLCPKIYKTKSAKTMHEKLAHSNKNKLFKCGYCRETFKWFQTKEKHLADVHGVKSSGLKCHACDRTFSTRSSYTIHQKRDHLMHKPHACVRCDMKFSTTTELKNHMVSHTGVRSFKCEVCLKAYPRKKTLTEHMRIHNNDRRFKCEHCGQAFVQKCSWRSHMRSKHDETL
ncbi:zinc finger protein 729 isoform X3 [Amyelois transitella]|uniref:zinc finger protein 729 isoform X3 n=1 Tax=Amyelois transitella TaxID=680683 RepID=UPI00298FDA83|nr:zinc finger protein 729 isoform X3 [Amyelois transitella]